MQTWAGFLTLGSPDRCLVDRVHLTQGELLALRLNRLSPSKGRCFPAPGDAMLERLETATGDYWEPSDVFKSHEPLVDVRDLVAYAFKE
jgi:hypothetical protein